MNFAQLIRLASAVAELLPKFKGEDHILEIAKKTQIVVDKFHKTPGGQALQGVKDDLEKAITLHEQEDVP